MKCVVVDSVSILLLTFMYHLYIIFLYVLITTVMPLWHLCDGVAVISTLLIMIILIIIIFTLVNVCSVVFYLCI